MMPTPKLGKGFLMLDPGEIHERDRAQAATIRGSFSFGVQTVVGDIPSIDLVVCGFVAVTEGGARVGKGGGYSEIEYAVLASLGKVDGGTPIVTSVHELQIVPEAPMEEHNFTVDYVATPVRLVGRRVHARGLLASCGRGCLRRGWHPSHAEGDEGLT